MYEIRIVRWMERGLGSQTLSRNQNDVIKILKGWVRRVGERIKSYKNENKKKPTMKEFWWFRGFVMYFILSLWIVYCRIRDVWWWVGRFKEDIINWIQFVWKVRERMTLIRV